MRPTLRHSIPKAALLVLLACGSAHAPSPATRIAIPAASTGRSPATLQVAPAATLSDTNGIVLELSEGVPEHPQESPVENAAVTVVADSLVDRLLASLPPLPEAVTMTFSRRADTPAPPLTGRTIALPFPSPDTNPAAPPRVAARRRTERIPVLRSGPLRPLVVERHSPEGNVTLESRVEITFSEPMVALTDADAGDPATRPVQLEPQPEGAWRWEGTKTLRFEARPRFPMSTAYHVRIPAGTKAQNGARLGNELHFQFATPTPRLVEWWPNGRSVSTEPVLLLAFDQEIDPDSAAARMKVEVRGRRVAVRSVSMDEISDPEMQRWIGRQPERRVVAVRPLEKLPADASCMLQIGPLLPSAEGPLRSNEYKEIFFGTYSPLVARARRCPARECEPGTPLVIEFNNLILFSSRNDSFVSVEPAIPGMKLQWQNQGVTIAGFTRGRTHYKVRLDPSITDIFGQKLGSSRALVFETGTASQMLYQFLPRNIVLDPEAPKIHRIYSMNVRQVHCRLSRVEPGDWQPFAYLQMNLSRWPGELPGKVVLDTVITIPGAADEFVETAFDLGPALDRGFGQCALVVEPLIPPKDAERQRYAVWIQSTGIGIDALNDGGRLITWATDIRNGTPLKGVEVTIENSDPSVPLTSLPVAAYTNEGGIAAFLLAENPGNLVVARRGRDLAILPMSEGDSYRSARLRNPRLAGFAFCDRGVYQPGEDLHFKGWLRMLGGPKGVEFPPAGLDSVEFEVTAQGDSRLKGTLPFSKLFGFDDTLTLPADFPPGAAMILIRAPEEYRRTGAGGRMGDNAVAVVPFQVQEFRRPEYIARVIADPGPWRLADRITATLEARLFSGSALADVPVTWKVSASPAFYFSPPNWRRFQFQADPWLFRSSRQTPRPPEWSGSLEGRTDSDGKHRLVLQARRIEPVATLSVSLSAAASDVNRQSLADNTSFLIHPSDVYVGLRSNRRFIVKGDPLRVDVIVAAIDGAAVPGRPVRLECVRIEEITREGVREPGEIPVHVSTVTSGRSPRTVELGTAGKGGTYIVRATVTDAAARRNQSAIQLQVEEMEDSRSAAARVRTASGNLRAKSALIECDRENYAAGDTVVMLVRSPIYPARGLVVITGRGISETTRFDQRGPTHLLRTVVPLNSPMQLRADVVLNGSEPRRDENDRLQRRLPFLPASAVGQLAIPIRPRERQLNVRITAARTELEPGDTTRLTLVVKDAGGQREPGAEAAVVIVDESILSLIDHPFRNPLDAFVADPSWIERSSLRELIRIVRAEDVRNRLTIGQGGGGGAMSISSSSTRQRVDLRGGVVGADGELHFRGGRSSEVLGSLPVDSFSDAIALGGFAAIDFGPRGTAPSRLRTVFAPVALFQGTVVTDDHGVATIPLKLPDNLTRYRIVAVAAAGPDRFGVGESNLTARLPLMVRPSPPRFLNAGDRFELPLVVENQSDAPIDALVGARAVNALFTDGRARRVVVPAHRRTEVRLPCLSRSPGEISAQVVVSGDRLSDAADIRIPVWTPATVEAFATYGEMDGTRSVRYDVAAPPDVHPEFGGLEVSTSSTALQSLTDAVLYIYRYPYDCTEQRASRVLAIATLGDVLHAFGVSGLPDSAVMAWTVGQDLEEIGRAQVEDGGFAFWPGRRGYPWLGIYVPHVLQIAKQKGHPVSSEVMSRSVEYLRSIAFRPLQEMTEADRIALRSYALYVLAQLDQANSSQVKRLVDEVGIANLPLDCTAWLLGALSGRNDADVRGRLIRRLLNNVAETAGLAQVVTNSRESDQLTLGSDRRVDAVVLDVLLSDGTAPGLVPKLARSLLAHRRNGRWRSTQENAFVLMALDHYFRSAEGVKPDFATQCWLGEIHAGAFRYQGRTTDRQQVTVPMAMLVPSDTDAGREVDRRGRGAADGAPDRPGGTVVQASMAPRPPRVVPLVLDKSGPGRMYYRLGLRWAPKSTVIPAEDAGFKVTRVYESVDDSGDVVRDPNGLVHVRAGARVRVTVTMMTPSRRYHVALVDPLPGGFEPLNPVLRGTDLSPGEGAGGSASRHGWWFDHQNLRSERAEAFCSWLREGDYTYSYLARATTPGEFTVPPPHAEEMYSPETFGRGESARVVVGAVK